MPPPNTSYLKASGEHERAGRIADALCALISAIKADNQQQMSHIYELNINRLLTKAKQKATLFMLSTSPIALFEQNRTPQSYASDTHGLAHNLPPIISLTAISGRIDRVETTVTSILKQSQKPHSINLYISEEPYLIDEGISRDNPALRRIADLGVNVYVVPNIGPYRKQVPLVIQLRSTLAPERAPIITIDDDVIYPPDIIIRLMTALETEEAVVAHRGRELTLEGGGLASYKKFLAPQTRSCMLNMGTGKNGIAYRLGYFPSNHEDYVGHILAPTADDIWCKWVISSYCIPTVILEPTAAFDKLLDFKEVEPNDKNGLFYKFNAKGTNDVAIANLEKYFSSKGVSVVAMMRDSRHV
jgi:hypothetical protein